MERIDGPMLKLDLTQAHVYDAGRIVGKLHTAGIIHGDLTTSNFIVRDGKCVLIDFGLSYISSEIESRGVDLHVFFQTLESTAPDHDELRKEFCEGYMETFEESDEVFDRVEEIRLRGRYL